MSFNSQPRIVQFFNVRPRDENNSRSFYDNRIADELRRVNEPSRNTVTNEESAVDAESLRAENEAMKQQLSKAQNEVKSLKKVVQFLNNEVMAKNIRIQQLQQICEYPRGNSVQIDSPQQETNINALYRGFEQHFTEDEMKKIRSVNVGKPNDSTFVLCCCQSLYKDKLDVLAKKSATGRKYKEKKEAISPQKKNMIQRMLLERITAEEDQDEAISMRINRLNKLLLNAINNTRKSIEKKS